MIEIFASERIAACCASTLGMLREVVPASHRQFMYVQPFSFGNLNERGAINAVPDMQYGITAGVNMMVRMMRKRV